MRRADRPGCEDHLAPGVGVLHRAAARVFDADGAGAVEQDAAHLRLGHELEIGPFQRRAQIGARGAAATPPAAGLLAIADPAMRQRIHVVAVFEPDLPAGLDRRPAQRRDVGHPRGEQRAALAAPFIGLALPILGLLEIGQDVVPRPAAIAELRPMVEILGLAAHIDEPVDRARSAEDLATRIEDRAPGGAGIGLGVIAPGQGRMVEQFHKAGRDMDIGAPVAPAGLDQQYPHLRVLAQAVGENAAGRSGADDHIVGLHPLPPSWRPGRPWPTVGSSREGSAGKAIGSGGARQSPRRPCAGVLDSGPAAGDEGAQ